MAWAFVQNVGAATGSVGTTTVTPTTNITSGNRLIALVCCEGSTSPPTVGISDNAGGGSGLTWYLEASATMSNSGVPEFSALSIYSAQITQGGGTKPTFTLTASGGGGTFGCALAVTEYSGLATTAAAIGDVSIGTGFTTAATSQPTGSTSATTAANELCMAFWDDDGNSVTSLTASGYTARGQVINSGNHECGAFEKDSGSSGSTLSATFTIAPATRGAGAVVVFKLAGGGGGTPYVPLERIIRQAVNRAAVF